MSKTPAKPAKTGRNTKGQFTPGSSGNPAGRKTGSRHRVTLAVAEMFENEAKKLTREVIDRAKAGDMQALKLCLERILPPLKERPVTLILPPVQDASDHPAAVAAVLAATARGELTPSEAQAFVALVEQHRRALELSDLETRIAALEVGQ